MNLMLMWGISYFRIYCKYAAVNYGHLNSEASEKYIVVALQTQQMQIFYSVSYVIMSAMFDY